KIEELKESRELKSLHFVRGDYFSESALVRANVRYARKVIILADTFESAAASEVDSKAVMTVLTIKAIARDVYTCVELLDKKFENYLKQAMCDEIIFSRDFTRRMLANATVTSGMSHIIYEFLSKEESSSKLSTCDIPDGFIGKPFSDYKTSFSVVDKLILIGILENTGSPNQIKIEALREAQKTSDVSRLVINLQKVKGLEINKPVLVPKDSYIIQKHSKAIVLERND
ncbi:MAG: NAD-binding protein, partial [Spirochaetota bacterium]